jgi:hypothetical protein
MPTNQVKFKVFAPNYGKLASVNPSGLSYEIRYFVPIYDPNFQSPTLGSLYDVTRNDFLTEDGMSHTEWWEQYESMVGGDVNTFDGQKLWLRGSFDPTTGRYVYASGYVLDANNVNVSTGLFNQTKLVSAITIPDCWKVKPYKPLSVTSTGGAVTAGSYDCVIPGNSGNFSWNKMALFLAELDVNGIETGNIFFFGMVYSNVRLVKNRLLNGAGQSISPNFTIRFNVIISGETYDPSRYDYLFFTEGFWYYLNTDTISASQKVLLGLYDGTFSEDFVSPLNIVRDLLNPESKSLSIGGIIQGTVPYAGVKSYHEYQFNLVRSVVMSEYYNKALHIAPFTNGEADHRAGGLLMGSKVLWNGENGLAFDYNTNSLGKGIRHDFESFGSWSIGKDIFNKGNFNINWGDGELVDDPTGLNFGMQTNGNFNFNFGVRNRIGAYWGTAAPYPRFGYGIFQFGSDNYAEGYNSINFGDCNYSNQRGSYLFGYKNQNRQFRMATTDYSSIGGLGSPLTDWKETHHNNMNVWMLGANNSILGRGLGSGSTGDGPDFTDVLIFGSHINLKMAPVSRHIIFGKNLSMGFGGHAYDRQAGILLGSDGHVGNAPYNHLTMLETSTLGYALGGFTSAQTNSYIANSQSGFSVSHNHAMSANTFSSIILYEHFKKNGAYGRMLRPTNTLNSSNVVTGTTDPVLESTYGDNIWDGSSSPNNIRQIDGTYEKTDIWRTAWMYYAKWNLIGKLFDGNSGHTYSVGNVGTVTHLQQTSSNTPIVMINDPSNADYIVLDSAQSPSITTTALAFNPSSRTVNGRRLYLYVTKLANWVDTDNPSDVEKLKGSMSFVGELYQVKEVKNIGGGLFGFRIANIDSNTTIPVPNNCNDYGFNFYQRGTAFVFIDNDNVDYLLNFGGRGFKGYVTNTYGTYPHKIIFSADIHNSSTFSIGTIGSGEFQDASGSLMVSRDSLRGGYLYESVFVGSDIAVQNTYGSSFVGDKHRHLYLDQHRMVVPKAKYMESDVNAMIVYKRFNFQKDHERILGQLTGVESYGRYESVFDSWYGTDLNANLNMFNGGSLTDGRSGHTAFTRLFGSHLYLGRDFIDGSIGTSGVMYADLFGYDINVMVRDSGGNSYKPQYNIHAKGMHLLVSRSDQFVFGMLNEGSNNNLFEFGAGHGNYQKMREYASEDNASREYTERRNGFAFGFLNNLSASQATDYDGKYPAFKVGTGILHFESEWDNWGGGNITRDDPYKVVLEEGQVPDDPNTIGVYDHGMHTPRDRVLMTKEVVVVARTGAVKEGDILAYRSMLAPDPYWGHGEDGSITIVSSPQRLKYLETAMARLSVTNIPSDANRVVEYSQLLEYGNDGWMGKRFIGIALLAIDADSVTNRTVMAFKGGPFYIKIGHIPYERAQLEGFPDFIKLLPSSWRIIQKMFEQDGVGSGNLPTYRGHFSIMLE